MEGNAKIQGSQILHATELHDTCDVAPEETSAKVIDGKAISADIRKELKEKVDKLQEQYSKVTLPLSISLA